MPSKPRINEGEGFIRSHDLLEELHADIVTAYSTLEADKGSQYLRRCVVRAVFSFIEAAIECIKVELKYSVRLGYFSEENLTDKDKETLGSISIFPDQNGKFLPLDTNIKRTFKLASKIWSLDFKLRTDNEDWQDFTAAKNTRNKLTHPRTFYDIQVTDEDMHCHTIAAWWVRREFQRLFKSRIEGLETLSGPEREKLLRAISLSGEPPHPT
ncbi:hypothetical protein [Pseudomonas sp. S32]|uniref:hypothetical protein n=1 Tax=Pseudomonas sp. S32 TaxID=2767448 RepID=UPI0019132914|nr:hypothetical protein [Pseudomonas sp. S32]MBK5007998.1 hypothetical protein [Pseudomonas sp. S32]